MARRKSVKRLINIGLPLIVVLMIVAALTTYFWQMRLQKQDEVKMANMADMAGMTHMEHMAGMVASDSEEGTVKVSFKKNSQYSD
ncbi:hypothetical protein ACFQ5D_04015 [Paenibacillus farraposensis]|uniref:Methyl-accepting chemotaxis protein n=1 Tax=Paenibacillus farraposensis TaxID=2807095 RepID=A0ABW4D7D6_9BACL|nr:hypothetical protein [Paenibacillus farraposensis]MCC3382202.1 hypothetical protein [Paenibacillus farraposensis]